VIGDAPTVSAGRRAPVRSRGLAPCLEQLAAAVDAAEQLGLDVAAARAVGEEAEARLRLAGEGYVLALVGGTGVGKSSLLNALAEQEVSQVSARRPTTSGPVAWVAEAYADQAAPLLDRLDVSNRAFHDGHTLAGVVVLDLPDMDSVDPAHRVAVEAILPKVDAVAWVTDPEKYADALLHDEFMARWIPRLDRQVVVLNKTDRLDVEAVRRVEAHLSQILGSHRPSSRSGRPEVMGVSAAGGANGVAPLRRWLAEAVDAKAIVTGRLAAAIGATIEDLARTAGATGEHGRRPIVDPAARRRTLDAAGGEVRRLVDLRGVERQAVAATRARARPRGAGPLGQVTSLAYRASGRQRRVADPGAYLGAWRSRGSLTRAAEPVRAAVADALGSAPPALRPALAGAGAPGVLESRLASAVDRAIAGHPPLEAPTSRVWSVLGLLATANTALIVVAVAWLLVWVLLRPPVDTVDLPVLGAVPVPFALLVLGVAAGFILARVLALHAGWVGRRWASRLSSALGAAVDEAVDAEAFAAVDRVEAARRALWIAARDAPAACA